MPDSTSTPNTNKTPQKHASQVHCLLRSELPGDIGGLRVSSCVLNLLHVLTSDCDRTHSCSIWGVINSKQVPSDPPSSLLASFNAHVSTQQQLYDCENRPCLLPLNHIKVGSSAPIASSARLATQVCRIKEHVLEYTQACLSKFGLTQWCPDLRQIPYSLFNSACRIIAIRA
jgi:hypothetical protein